MSEEREVVYYTHPQRDGTSVSTSFVATITDTGEGFTLMWHDGVINEWNETYLTLGAAMARLGLLIDTVDADAAKSDRGTVNFADVDAAGWHQRWEAFKVAWPTLLAQATVTTDWSD